MLTVFLILGWCGFADDVRYRLLGRGDCTGLMGRSRGRGICSRENFGERTREMQWLDKVILGRFA
jgi:hypothetical protein